MGSTETVVMYLVFLEIDGAKHRILQLNALMGFRINLNGTIRGEHSKLIFCQSWDSHIKDELVPVTFVNLIFRNFA